MAESNLKDLFFLNEDIRGFDNVIVYGAGNAGKGVFLRLLQHNVKTLCFADSDPEICGSRYLNIPVVHIDDLAEYRSSAAVVVCGRFALTVAEELEKRGFVHIFMDHGNDSGVVHLDRE